MSSAVTLILRGPVGLLHASLGGHARLLRDALLLFRNQLRACLIDDVRGANGRLRRRTVLCRYPQRHHGLRGAGARGSGRRRQPRRSRASARRVRPLNRPAASHCVARRQLEVARLPIHHQRDVGDSRGHERPLALQLARHRPLHERQCVGHDRSQPREVAIVRRHETCRLAVWTEIALPDMVGERRQSLHIRH